MPPTTTSARGFCTCEPMPVDTAAGSSPTQAAMQVIGPHRVRFALHKAWPKSIIKIVPDAGHSSLEPGIVSELVKASDMLAAAMDDLFATPAPDLAATRDKVALVIQHEREPAPLAEILADLQRLAEGLLAVGQRVGELFDWIDCLDRHA